MASSTPSPSQFRKTDTGPWRPFPPREVRQRFTDWLVRHTRVPQGAFATGALLSLAYAFSHHRLHGDTFWQAAAGTLLAIVWDSVRLAVHQRRPVTAAAAGCRGEGTDRTGVPELSVVVGTALADPAEERQLR